MTNDKLKMIKPIEMPKNLIPLFKSTLHDDKKSVMFDIQNCEHGTNYFCELVETYRAIIHSIDISEEKITYLKAQEIEDNAHVKFISKISAARSNYGKGNFYFIVDISSEVNLQRYGSIYIDQHFSKTKVFRYITKRDYERLFNIDLGKYAKDININLVAKETVSIDYVLKTVSERSKYLEKINNIVNSHPISNLDFFSPGNLYVLIDCEYENNTRNVNEISILFTEMIGVQLVPISKVMCKDQNSIKTCAQFITYFNTYLQELKQQYNVGKVYFVGHGIYRDITAIYNTLGLTCTENYTYIDTGDGSWFSTWESITGHSLGQIKLQELKKAYLIEDDVVEKITEEIFDISGAKQHTSMFDVTLLFILLNLVLLHKVDIDEYRKMHLGLINNL